MRKPASFAFKPRRHSLKTAGVDDFSSNLPGKRVAMILAHPGHELRAYHWLELTKPMVMVLTDGSGRTDQSRLDSTTKILTRCGASIGPVYGRYTDNAVYASLLAQRRGEFVALLEEIAQALQSADTDAVLGDALEGYNPSHDLCRYLIDAAIQLARRRTGRNILNYDFLLVGRPDACPEELKKSSLWLKLNDTDVERKLAAAEAYPELKEEVVNALNKFGKQPFAVECLRPVAAPSRFNDEQGERPYYETHGEQQVAAGYYKNVIRLREHMRPLAEYLWDYASTAK